MVTLSRYKRGMQVFAALLGKVKLARWLGHCREALHAGRYEQGQGSGCGVNTEFPDWFDEEMIDWVHERQVAIAKEKGLWNLEWRLWQWRTEERLIWWKMGWRVYKEEGKDVLQRQPGTQLTRRSRA